MSFEDKVEKVKNLLDILIAKNICHDLKWLQIGEENAKNNK